METNKVYIANGFYLILKPLDGRQESIVTLESHENGLENIIESREFPSEDAGKHDFHTFFQHLNFIEPWKLSQITNDKLKQVLMIHFQNHVR